MAKGPILTDEVKRLIAELNDEHPEWMAKEVKKEIQARLRQLGHQTKPDWPGITAVQIELKKIRAEREKGPLPIDGPWSIGRLAEDNIPAGAVSKVLEIQSIRANHEQLTIREAVWIGRLHTVTDEIMELAVWAAMYADRDRLCDIANLEKDTSDLDSTVQSKLVTGIFYFPWLFGKTWIPDSYKKQVAEEQTLKYERLCGLELDRPDFSLNGWLIYAHTLLYAVIYDKRCEVPRELCEFLVAGDRQLARNEGRILMAESGKYLDLLQSIKKGVVYENLYNEIEEIIGVSDGKETEKLLDTLHKGEAPTNEGGKHARSHSQEG